MTSHSRPARASGVRLEAASGPRGFQAERLLWLEPERRALSDRRIVDLPELLQAGDVLVVNDAATLPASLRASNWDVEIRLLGRDGESGDTFRALALGAGDYRTPTEHRPPPPPLPLGTHIEFGELSARVVRVEHARLLVLRFDRTGADLLAALYRVGRVVQYAYIERQLELWDVQNRFAARPWAAELPSAGRPLTWDSISQLRRRGVAVVWLTHAAGVSSTGEEALDQRLPLPELSHVPAETLDAIVAAQGRGGHVVAVGTTVVRALEDRALRSSETSNGKKRGLAASAGTRRAELLVGPGFRPRIVTALLTGLHEPTSSHFALMQAFAPRQLLERAAVHAGRAGYLQHEFGDSLLILGARPEPRVATTAA